jgi:hypothetical protein
MKNFDIGQTPTLSRRTMILAGLSSTVLAGCGSTLKTNTPAPRLEASAVSAPNIISTAEWGARRPTETVQLTGSRPDKIIVHHTAGENSNDFSRAHAIELTRNIQSAHINGNKWIDTGQNFTITRGGFVLEGRHRSLETLRAGREMVASAHCIGQNTRAIGIENEGTFITAQPTQTQYNQLVSLCAYICQQYGIPADRIYGHRDFDATECPGSAFYPRLAQLRRDVAAKLGAGGSVSRVWGTLKLGDKNERVKTVQLLLKSRKLWSKPTDGNFSAELEAAVKRFQTSKNLSATGTVTRFTWETLITNVRRGSLGDAVLAIQSQLVARGLKVALDGDFGPATEAAVKRFQASKGLVADGIIGPDTWAKFSLV